MNETKLLAEWVSQIAFESMPTAVIESIQLFLLDNVGCMIGGAKLPWSLSYYQTIKSTRSGHHSTVIYYGDKHSPDEAAFLNSSFGHANESDDTHLASPTHLGSIAIPSALALGEYCNCSGKQLLLALIAAYEVQIRIASACSPHLINRGHHPPAGVGPFGGAAAGAVLLGFDKQKTIDALGIAGSYASGLLEYTQSGGSVKRVHCAISAQGGVRAAMFAQAGITGPQAIIEGTRGFCNVFAGDQYHREQITKELGSTYRLLENGLKIHSCCFYIHGFLETLDRVRSTIEIIPEQIKSITLYIDNPDVFHHICSIREPKDVLGAQFSLPFSLAMRLWHGGKGVEGGNGFWDYLSVDLANPHILNIVKKISCILVDSNQNTIRSQLYPFIMELNDGRLIEQELLLAKGIPKNPLSSAEVQEKFLFITEKNLPRGRVQKIINMIENISDLPDIKTLIKLLINK
ncbi:MmgE/PrpD family protein [Legionella sp. WA2022007384]